MLKAIQDHNGEQAGQEYRKACGLLDKSATTSTLHRNTAARRKSRLALTLFTLTMGGAIFIAVFNVRVTLHDYIGQIGKYFGADVSVDFDRPYRLTEIQQKVMQIKGVQHVEGWQFISGELLDEESQVLENINIFGPPAESSLIEPLLISGRWIRAGDVRKLAVSENVLEYYPDLEPGHRLNLRIHILMLKCSEGKEI